MFRFYLRFCRINDEKLKLNHEIIFFKFRQIMSELALKLIAENKAKHARGERPNQGLEGCSRIICSTAFLQKT
jgi:hypothetical protein